MTKSLIILALLGSLLIGSSLFLTLNKPVSEELHIDNNVKTLWKQWKLQYGRRFADPEQDQYRLEVFADNLKFVESDKSGTMGIT